MGEIRGILLDGLVLLDGNASLQRGADSLLRKLRHSKIPTGISYGSDLSADKASVLKDIAILHSIDCFSWNASSIEDDISKILLAWGGIERSILYTVTNIDEDLYLKLQNRGWLIVVQSAEGGGETLNSSMLHINKLEELPLTICRINRKVISKEVLTIGYTMKPSREEDFAKRGAFPMDPTQSGLIFLPLTFELSISSQLQEIDAILHKATDEIISIELSNSSGSSNRITYTSDMQLLKRYLDNNPECCVIDPFNNIYPVLDRLKIQQILLGLEELNREGCRTIRAPHFLKVDDFKEPTLIERLTEAKLSLPSIVKPQVACGVAEAHNMAIVFKMEDYRDLSNPCPAVIQEYVDHSSTIYKCYVLGEKLFYAVKKSIPNADMLIKLSEKKGLKPLVFDSLKSLPIAKDGEQFEGVCSMVKNWSIDIGLMTDAASWLRNKLDLTIFGFDVVIEEGSGDHVIVDVNYLPSFKEVPDNTAIPAFWDAIKKRIESTKLEQASRSSFT